MAVTRQDLITAVLENLGVLAAGQSASIEDRGVVDRRIDPKLTELARREVFAGLDADALDPALYLYVADVIAAACLTPFGITGAKAEGLVAAAARAEAALKALSTQFSTTAAAAGFNIVQHVLEALGVMAPGQVPSAQDQGVVTARIAPLLADLRAREVIAIPSLAAADPATLPHLATLLLGRCAPAFGPDATARAGQVDAVSAEAALRGMARQFDVGAGTAGTFDLAQSVLEMLGVVDGGQTASAKDRAVVLARAPLLLADLRQRDIVDLASVAAADQGTLLHLAVLLAYRCAPLFGASETMTAALRGERAEAERALRRIGRQIDSGSGTSGAFDAIQATLERLGVVEAGYTATGKDRAVVEARVAPLLADLRLRDVIALPSLAGADPGTLPHVTTLLAAACAEAFDLPPEMRGALVGQVPGAEAALRLTARQFDQGAATSGTYDVVQAVLENLGVVLAGFTGSPKDRAVISARAAPMLADLRLREIVDIASLEVADPGTLPHLANILTASCAQAFGIDRESRILFAAEAVKAETALKALARQLDGGPGTAGYFDPEQAALEMLGIVAAGQSASAKDRAVVAARVQPLLQSLRGRDICGVEDISQLTGNLQAEFARLLAADCALSFGEVPPARIAMLQGMVAAAEQSLRYQSFIYDARRPMRIDAGALGGRRPCRGGWR